MGILDFISNEIKEGLDNIKKEAMNEISDFIHELKSIPSELFSDISEYDDDDDYDNDDYHRRRIRNESLRQTTPKHKADYSSNNRTVIIKGTYQMNGPKPFIKEITCSPSEVGYYSQLMGNKRKQAEWLQANFPGVNTARGFSMSVNIK